MKILTLEVSWDTQDPLNTGWYVFAKYEDGSYADDSMKVWFPVYVDEFGQDEIEALIAELEEEFPNAEILVA